ncbi:DUF2255 family protein [Nakamurella sp. YIM 132087]|uniref:DUF2255 family protein n=1 Tax=Nakamurella alba TaxID=2665158 RepID=A0A7K1FRQ5_9ACTN|nr:DUF2255 family protein [Nakamurella alba]MTD16828.1 DUF2255 family protein [Nakamurella alba]
MTPSSEAAEGWDPELLAALARAVEVDVTTRRPDGTLRAWVPIWLVGVGDRLYARSWKGTRGAWYRHASRLGEGLLRLDGTETVVHFHNTGADIADRSAIDDGYRAKYGDHGAAYIEAMTGEQATATTLLISPG